MWLPYYDSWGHNGRWYLEARVHYRRMMPPGGTATAVVFNEVNVLDIVVDATSTANPPGLPDDSLVLAIDTTAEGTVYEHPTIHWEIHTVLSAQQVGVFLIRIRDAVTGTVVKTVNKAAIPNFALTGDWAWDGTMDGVPPPPQGPPAYGLYTYEVDAESPPNDGYRTGSRMLELSNPWAALADYNAETQKLPVTLHYGLGLDNRPASAAQLYVYNGSKTNPQHFSQVGGAVDLATDLGQHELALDMDPLDGCPYYLLVFARDDHGDDTMDGDRDHKDRVAQCRAVRLTYQVPDVYPKDDGRVYISDTLGRFDGVPTLFEQINTGTPENPVWVQRRCQTANREAKVQALVTVSAEDAIPGNDEQTMNLHCGGAEVHFAPQDPDSHTLWDPDENGGDNDGGAGTVDPAGVVAEPKTLRHGGQDVVRALAETTLTITNQFSGDNYFVEASPYDGPVEGLTPAHSSTLEAWKLIYYERDRMPLWGDSLDGTAPQGQTFVKVMTDASWFNVGDEVMVFDGQHHDVNSQAQRHHIKEIDLQQRVLTFEDNEPLQYTYQGYPVGGVAVPARGYHSAIDTALLGGAFGDGEGFVDFQPYPGEQPGIVPLQRFAGFGEGIRPYFDHREPNVLHLIDGKCWQDGRRAVGDSDPEQLEAIVFDEIAPPGAWQREALVHEVGHLFDMPDYLQGHVDHANHANTDGCVMVYDNDTRHPLHPNGPGNGIALFGGVVVDPPEGEPKDLRDEVAGHEDPLRRGVQ